MPAFTDADTRNRVRFARQAPPDCLDESFQADFSFRDRGSHITFLKNHRSPPGPDTLYVWYCIDGRPVFDSLLDLDLSYPEQPAHARAGMQMYASANHFRSHIEEHFGHTGAKPVPPVQGICRMHMAATNVLEVAYELRATGPGPVTLRVRAHSRPSATVTATADAGDLTVSGQFRVVTTFAASLRLWSLDGLAFVPTDAAWATEPAERTLQPGQVWTLRFRCTTTRGPTPPPRRDELGATVAATIAEHDAALARVPDLPADMAVHAPLVSTAIGTLRTLRYADITRAGEPVTTIHAGKSGVAATWFWDTAFTLTGLGVMHETEVVDGAMRLLTGGLGADGEPACKMHHGHIVGGAQQPILAWGFGQFLRRNPDDAMLARVYPDLVRYVHWWLATGVDAYDGLVPYPPGGVCWDDSLRWQDTHPVGDRSPWYTDDYGRMRAQSFLSVDTNSHLYLECLTLARCAARLGRQPDADRWQATADALALAIQAHLYDPESRCYQDRDRRDGRFTGMLTPACFMPIYAGIAPTDIARRLCRDLLLDPDRFYTQMPFPTLDRAHPCFRSGGGLFAPPAHPGALVQHAYWTGRTWPHVSVWLVGALHRAGLTAEADTAAQRILHAMGRHPAISENYDALTGEPTGHPEFMWSAAAVLDLAYHTYRDSPAGP